MTSPEEGGPPEQGGAFTDEEREQLARIAEQLIPAAHAMPSAREVGVAGDLLNQVLTSRPDLREALHSALAWAWVGDDVETHLARLRGAHPAAVEALLLVIAGGYYLDPGVRSLIGYPGQVPRRVTVGGYPPYLAENLLDAVVARGPIFRDPGSG